MQPENPVNQQVKNFDVIIVGGGVVGAGLAVSLRDAALRVALIDARSPSMDDPRLFALNYSSCQFLTNLGLWSRLQADACPISEVHVSYQGHFGSARMHCNDVNLSTLGHVIPAYVIESVLNDELLSAPHITLFRPATLLSLTQAKQQACLQIEKDGVAMTLQAPIIIGADGTESTVRKELGIAIEEFDYGQLAIVTRTTLRRSHHHIAYERFQVNGAIAMLPLRDEECATIWTVEKARAKELLALSDADFLQALQQAFGYRLGRLQAVAKRHSYPLRMLRAEKNVQQCVLLLGNAAHTLSPIAAQGFNLALYEVAAIVEAIMHKNNKQEKISMHDIAQIIEQTAQQQAASMGISHRLSKLFAKPGLLLSLLAPLGMIGFNHVKPIKTKFMQKALGQTGRVPRLLLSLNE